MKNIALSFAITTALLINGAGVVLADSYSVPQQSYSIAIDKQVSYPELKDGKTVYTYVDNLGSNDYAYIPGGYIFFKVKVKNTSSANLDNVVLKDFAPQYVDVFTTQINVGTLQPQEEKEYIIQARVQQNTPNQAMTCVTNTAHVSNDKVSAQDTASVCIRKVIAPPETIPNAGPEFGLGITALSAMAGYFGLKLRKSA
ncbi:MAG: hypothetical protein WBO77_02260 [Microgenomates group bacterium]